MRITKKFTGDSCIGKRIFQPLSRYDFQPENSNASSNPDNIASKSDGEILIEGSNENRVKHNDNEEDDTSRNSYNLEAKQAVNGHSSSSASSNNDKNIRSINSTICHNNNNNNDNNNNNNNNNNINISNTDNQNNENTNSNNLNNKNKTPSNDSTLQLNINHINCALIDSSRKELKILRRIWLEKILSSEREMARKNVKTASTVRQNSGRNKVYFTSIF